MRVAAIVPAAGSGERLGLGPKALVEVGGRPLLAWVAEALRAWGVPERVVVAAPIEVEDRFRAILADAGLEATVVPGGPTRSASVREALRVLPASDWDAIVCHDAARPFATAGLFEAVTRELADGDGAVPVVRVSDTVKRVREGSVVETIDRRELALAQTPQAFRAAALHDAHRRSDATDASDDAMVLERTSSSVRAVAGDPMNLKVTTAGDLRLAEAIASARA